MSCVIAAPSSGSGKTLLSLLIASWATREGLSIQPFKVGPDYLDPQHLSAVSKRPCRNLDIHLCGEKWVIESFHGFGGNADLALIEGVMGLFDGVGSSSNGSTANIARLLNVPVILIVDARGQSASLGALIKGFRDQDPEIHLAGVVLNRISSDRHKVLLKEVLDQIDVRLLGCLPNRSELQLPSRHLGLVPVNEIKGLDHYISKWAEIAKSNLNLTELIRLLKAPPLSKSPIESLYRHQKKLRQFPVAIAEDNAFHFRYEETKECLESYGMPLLKWKPTEDEPIPKEAKGLIIPGGFPEQYAKQLSLSKRSLNELKLFCNSNPVYAECGGMLLLGRNLTALDNQTYRMADILPFDAQKGKLQVGYREMKAKGNGLILNCKENLHGHEFHRWEINPTPSKKKLTERKASLKKNQKTKSLWVVKGYSLGETSEGWGNSLLHASWIHIHWASNPNIITKWRLALERRESE